MTIINLTPHVVRLNSGEEYPPSGTVARMTTAYSPVDDRGVASVVFGEVVGLPQAQPDTLLVVSGLIAGATPQRSDVVAPATGHPACVRKDGQVFSVPCWVK